MTTITIIVIVALVFFAALCVTTLLIWKRETEMRTDSLKAIEQNLDRMIRELNDRNHIQRRKSRADHAEENVGDPMNPADDEDPFAWVKKREADDKETGTGETKDDSQEAVPKVSLDDKPAEAGMSDDEAGGVSDVSGKEEISKQLVLEESFREIESLINELTEDMTEYEIDLDLIVAEEMNSEDNNAEMGTDEVTDIEDQYLDIQSAEFEKQPARVHMGYDTGRSGRKYTAEELEMLIKE